MVLCREGDGRSQRAHVETSVLPRVTVRSRPVDAAAHWGGRLKARTPTHLSYEHPNRETVWRESFDRCV